MHLFRQKRRDEKTGALVPSGPWYAEYREPTGRRVRVRLEGRDGRPLRDERVAKLAAAELTRRLELGSVGVERHTATRARRPLDLAEDYVKELARLGRAALHVSTTRTRLRRVLGDFPRVEDVTPETVRETLVRLSEAHGFGPKTQNYHRLALSAFFAWLIKEGRWGANPVASVPRAAEDEPETPRRALTAEELEALLAATPEPRATVYRVAATTGLRRAELRALRWVGLDLDAGTLTLPGRSTKNRREAVLPLPPGTVAALLRHKEDAEKGAKPEGDDEPEKGDAERAPVFKSLPGKRTFDRDLARAKLVRLTAEGKLVFHSLRSTFATSLARTGAPLTLTQKLMRHSTPTLTANVYTRLSLHDGRAAVAAIDLPFGDVPRGAGRGAAARAATFNTALTRTPALDVSSTRPERQAANPQGVGRMDGPGLEPGTPGFSVLDGIARAVEILGSGGDSAPARGRARGDAAPDPAPSDPESLARALLAAAATASDPRPLLEAATALLEQAREAKAARGVLRLREGGA